MIYLIKYWKQALLLAVAVVFVISWNVAREAYYQRGHADATAKISRELAENARKHAEKAHEASADYQQELSERQEKERIRYVEVQKIIRRPVYINRCLDDDGVQVINDSADGK